MANKRENKKRKPTAILSCLIFTKSTMESIIESIAPLWGLYSDFCTETTLHGLRHTVEPKLHFLERLLWIILSVSAFAGAVYCALSQFSRYSQEPVVVSLQRDYRRWQTTFPAVTACFLERINPDKAKEAIEKHWNVTEESDPDRFQYYTEFLELVTDVSFRENLQNFWKYQDDETVGGINLLQLALSVHPVEELSVRMSHTDKGVTWHAVMTEMGMCLSINSEYAEYQHMNDTPWTLKELLSCHYLSGQCYVRIDSIDNAVRFFIHSPFEIATAVSNPTGEIAPGEELIIDFKMKYTTLSMLMVLAAVAAVGHSSAIDPSPSDPDLTSLAIGYGSEDLPEGSYGLEVSEGLETSEGEADALNDSSPAISARNRLLFRGQYIRNAVSNTVHIHNQTWRGSSVITSVRAWQVGTNQGATARITAGGVGFTHVTVQMRSAVSRGFNIIMEVYGR